MGGFRLIIFKSPRETSRSGFFACDEASNVPNSIQTIMEPEPDIAGRIQQRCATATPATGGWDGVATRKPNHQVWFAECATTISSKKDDTQFPPSRRLVGPCGPSGPSWGGHLHLALRIHKQRRKRRGVRERPGTIPNQVLIDQRPAIVDARERYGDWEADLVVGACHSQALVTINER